MSIYNPQCKLCHAFVMECLIDRQDGVETWWCKDCGSLLTIVPQRLGQPDRRVWKVAKRAKVFIQQSGG